MAQIAFAQEPLEARSRLLEGVSHALVEDDRRIAETIVAESGKPLAEAYVHDLIVAADSCSWLAANLGRVLRDEKLRFPQLVLRHKRGAIRYAPLGVVAVVSPWNFPLALPLRHAAAAVAAGNAVVLKPSELTPMSGALVEELFRRAGAPPGLVRVVQGPGESVGDALVRHRGIDGVVFTGSTEVGRLVAQAAAERFCPAVLELGGKDPMLVLDDADLDRAIEGALWGAFANCGQACAGIERIAVPPGLHDEFVRAAGTRRGGPPCRPRVRSGRRARPARRRGAAGPLRGSGRRRGRARCRRRYRRPAPSDGPAGLVPRADGPARRATGRTTPYRRALRSRGLGCRNRQRRGDDLLGQRLPVRPRRERLVEGHAACSLGRREARGRHGVGQRPRILVRRRADAVGRTTLVRTRHGDVAVRPPHPLPQDVRPTSTGAG